LTKFFIPLVCISASSSTIMIHMVGLLCPRVFENCGYDCFLFFITNLNVMIPQSCFQSLIFFLLPSFEH
jgi:hypothetical protein